MPDTNPPTPSQVQDKRQKPPGILPKNTQAWVLSGLALLMVAVIAFSGKNTPRQRGGSPSPPDSPPVWDENSARISGRIQEYQRRIEEQARKVQREQEQLARAQQSVRMAPHAPGGSLPSYSQNDSPYPRGADVRYSAAEANPDNSIQVEKKKREYESLFASNIALSYRREFAREAAPAGQASASAKILPFYGYPAKTASLPQAALPVSWKAAQEKNAAALPPTENKEGSDERTTKRRQQYAELNRAEGKEYRLFEGTVFETVLTNRLDGSFSGPVNCMVTTNIYSHDGQRLLVPQGSRVLGEVRKIQTFGDERLAVFFHRLIMPDGYSVSLDKFQGLNQIGETGLRDQVNHHYLQVFGVSLAIGAIAGLSQANTRYGLNESAGDAYRQGVSASLSQSSLRILDRYLNVLPTFTIREGHRVKVYLSDDLLLPAYEKHQMPSDL
jgi:type IV secretion system protein VirB10